MRADFLNTRVLPVPEEPPLKLPGGPPSVDPESDTGADSGAEDGAEDGGV